MNRIEFKFIIIIFLLTWGCKGDDIIEPEIYADLYIASSTVEFTNIEPGESVQISCNVRNLGKRKSPFSILGFYLSTDQTYDATDNCLASFDVECLEPNGSYSESEYVYFSNNLSERDYYILIVVDEEEDVIESNESNNVVNKKIKVAKKYPNLVISEQIVTPDVVVAGDQIKASCKVENIGEKTAESSDIKFYISTDQVYDNNDIYLDYETVYSINSGEYSNEYEYFDIPSNTSGGDYYILFVTDADFDVEESDETDNIAYKEITIEKNYPNLVIEEPILSEDVVVAGEQVRASCRVINSGEEVAGASYIKFYLSNDNIFDNGDIYVDYKAVASINQGEFSDEYEYFNIPDNVAGGSYYLLFVADANSEVLESNENDNVAFKAIRIYCESFFTDTDDDWISRVDFDDIDHYSGSTGYSDYTYYIADSYRGNTYTLSVTVTVNGSYEQHVKAWIDFNADGYFDNYDEDFYLGYVYGTGTLSKQIIIPYGATTGSTRMRIIERYGDIPSPCDQEMYGETEDYTINIH